MGKQWKQWQTIFLGSKITTDGDCSHEIKRHLLLEGKVMTEVDSILKSIDITLPTKVHLVKAMVFPVVMYGCESWTTKKTECWGIDAFELWCWRRLLRVPWTARRSNQSILKEIFSCAPLFVTPWTTAGQASLSITNSQSLLKLTSIKSVMPSNHQILCRPLLLLPPIFPSSRVFWKESVLHIRWPKYWGFSFSINLSNEYSGLISFRIDWFDLLAVQGTLKSLLQHHSSKASILWYSAFFMVQLSHLYMTTGKTTILTRQTFVRKVMSLLFNKLPQVAQRFWSES